MHYDNTTNVNTQIKYPCHSAAPQDLALYVTNSPTRFLLLEPAILADCSHITVAAPFLIWHGRNTFAVIFPHSDTWCREGRTDARCDDDSQTSHTQRQFYVKHFTNAYSLFTQTCNFTRIFWFLKHEEWFVFWHTATRPRHHPRHMVNYADRFLYMEVAPPHLPTQLAWCCGNAKRKTPAHPCLPFQGHNHVSQPTLGHYHPNINHGCMPTITCLNDAPKCDTTHL